MGFISMDEVFDREGLKNRGRMRYGSNLTMSRHEVGDSSANKAIFRLAFHVSSELANKANLGAGDMVNFVFDRKTKECYLEKVIDGKGGRTLSGKKDPKLSSRLTVAYPYFSGYHLPLPAGNPIIIPDDVIHPKRNSIVFSLDNLEGIEYK